MKEKKLSYDEQKFVSDLYIACNYKKVYAMYEITGDQIDSREYYKTECINYIINTFKSKTKEEIKEKIIPAEFLVSLIYEISNCDTKEAENQEHEPKENIQKLIEKLWKYIFSKCWGKNQEEIYWSIFKK